jgi:hypothetical protein
MCNCGNNRIVIVIEGWQLLLLCSFQLPHSSPKLVFLTDLFLFLKYKNQFFFSFFFKAKVGFFHYYSILLSFSLGLCFFVLLWSAWFLLHHFYPILTHLSNPKLIILCPKFVLGPKSVLGPRLVVLNQTS